VLAGELHALDEACRQRYGPGAGACQSSELSTGIVAPGTDGTRSRDCAIVVQRLLPPDWPSVPGLELEEVLGYGGMGVVYRARQVALDRDVAVKFLRDAHRSDSGRRERFLQEARAVARLRHPHLVQLYEFGELPGAGSSQPYLVLEYVPGGSLASLLRSAPQRPAEAARLVETLADAIHYAHQQGVIHRDLKPANVLMQQAEGVGTGPVGSDRVQRPVTPRRLGPDLCAKITDFGLAKLLAGGDLTQTGDVLGTPSYMAPEQAWGKSASLTAAVDIYGLGAILYEALTGRPPFAAATVDATLGQVRQDEPVPPRRLQPTVPRDLETICLKSLRKEASRRYATARELADDLRRFQAGEPVRARPVGVGERLVVRCRRRPGVAALLAALAFVFVAGSSGVVWQWQCANHHAAEAERNAAAYRHERDTASQEKERAERQLQLVRDRVGTLERLGHDILKRPGQYRTGQAVLEEALAFYQQILPEEGNDPRVRQEAAKLFGQVAWIHQTLGQADKAAESWSHQASLVESLLKEQPENRPLRILLADILRWRGNMMRDLSQGYAAREYYARAAEIHEGLVRDFPQEPEYKVALANTLLNQATLLSRSGQSDAMAAIYDRVEELDRAAVRAKPADPRYRSELALALGARGRLLLETGRCAQAEVAVRESVDIYRKLLAGGSMKGALERYMARNLGCLGRVLAAAGNLPEAERFYREAVKLLDELVEQHPESAYARVDRASTLVGLAELLSALGRASEAESMRRRAIDHYESLRKDFPEEPDHCVKLVESYLDLAGLLCDPGRQSEATELFHKALAVAPDDPATNNQRAWYLTTAAQTRFRDSSLALRLAQKAVAARPQSADFRNTLGAAHYRNGDDRAAIAELEQAMSLRSGGDCYDWFFLAMAHCRSGDRSRALAWLDRATQTMDKSQPRNAELRRLRAEAEAALASAGE
jgi:serine/threonine protein kinase/Flp pilus assembly protein TadD